MPASRECPLCGRGLLWIITLEQGARIACDIEPTADGNLVRVELPSHAIRAMVLAGEDMPWLGDVNRAAGPYRAHEKTCTRVARRTKQPACRDCGGELHPLIVARGGDLHWLCGGVPRPALVPVGAPDSTPEQLDLPEAS